MSQKWWRGMTTFTSGGAAKVLGCRYMHIYRYCREGLLKHWVVPGGENGKGQIRIEKRELIRFAKDNNLPLPLGFGRDVVVVVALVNKTAAGEKFGKELQQGLGRDFSVTAFADSVRAGAACAKDQAQALVVVEHELAHRISSFFSNSSSRPYLLAISKSGHTLTGFDRVLKPLTSAAYAAGVLKDQFPLPEPEEKQKQSAA